MIKARPALLICSTALLLSGCAHDQAFQRVASLSAASTVKMKKAVSDYADQANDLRAQAALDIQSLQDATRARSVETAAAQQSWKAAGDVDSRTALAVFDAVSAFGRDPTLNVSAPPLFGESAPTVVPLKFDASTYDGLTKALTDLAKPKSTVEEAERLAGYANSVAGAYEADVKAAAGKTADAKSAGGAASATTVDSTKQK